MAVVDEKLAGALKQARKAGPAKPYHFALAIKGGKDGALVVAKHKVSSKDISQAKAKSGGSAVLIGKCFGDDGKFVFETPRMPPGTLSSVLKTVIRRDAGLSILPVVRLAAPPVEEEEDTETDAEKKKEKLTDKFLGRMNDLLEWADDLEGPGAAQVKKVLEKANQIAQNDDFPAGFKLLDQAEKMLDSLNDGVPPPPEEDGTAPLRRELEKRLKAANQILQLAVQTKHDSLSQLKTLVTTAAGLFKNGDLEQADKVLDEVDPIAAKIQVPAPKDDKAQAAQVQNRLKVFVPQVRSAVRFKDSAAAQMTTLIKSAEGLFRNKDFAQAQKVLDELEPLIKKARTNRPPALLPIKRALNQRLNRLKHAFKKAIEQKNPQLREMVGLFKSTDQSLKSDDVKGAAKDLQTLEKMLK